MPKSAAKKRPTEPEPLYIEWGKPIPTAQIAAFMGVIFGRAKQFTMRDVVAGDALYTAALATKITKLPDGPERKEALNDLKRHVQKYGASVKECFLEKNRKRLYLKFQEGRDCLLA